MERKHHQQVSAKENIASNGFEEHCAKKIVRRQLFACFKSIYFKLYKYMQNNDNDKLTNDVEDRPPTVIKPMFTEET